ncbi:MAG: hypothetical protein AAGC44_07420 [Planctomycetota bacterium]
MNATETLQQWFDASGRSLPGLTMGGLILCMTIGLLVWLAGGKLLKPAMVVGGLVLGLTTGGLLSPFIESTGFFIVFIIGLGIAGALLAGLTFRLWMAMSAAVVLATVVPAAMLVWQNTPTNQITGPGDTEQQAAEVRERYETEADQLSPESREMIQGLIKQQSPTSLASANSILDEQGGQAIEAIKGVVFEHGEQVKQWWEQNTTAAHRMAIWGMIGGALVGLLIGIIMPKHAAALQSAMVGAVLIFVPGRELVVGWAPEGFANWMPVSPRGTLLALGLITLLGFCLQWTLYLKPDDK